MINFLNKWILDHKKRKTSSLFSIVILLYNIFTVSIQDLQYKGHAKVLAVLPQALYNGRIENHMYSKLITAREYHNGQQCENL